MQLLIYVAYRLARDPAVQQAGITLVVDFAEVSLAAAYTYWRNARDDRWRSFLRAMRVRARAHACLWARLANTRALRVIVCTGYAAGACSTGAACSLPKLHAVVPVPHPATAQPVHSRKGGAAGNVHASTQHA